MSLGAACNYHPARFADRPTVEEVDDERPSPIPDPTPFIEPIYLSEVYLRRPIVDALDPERFPYAQDVNALDEVPHSSWFEPIPLDPEGFDKAYAHDGAPVPPLRVERERDGRVLLTDSRGKSYSMRGDPAELPATQSAAAIIASRLLRAFGYKTPEAWPLDRKSLGVGAKLAPKSGRLVALRWPLGFSLGATDMTRRRDDDPNDRISHRDRRTLRALGVMAAWLDLGDLGPSRVVDAYVGRPGYGHVEHFVIGLYAALSTGAFTPDPAAEVTAAGVVRGNPFASLATLGLARPKPPALPSEHSLRVFSPDLRGAYELRIPYEAVDRLLYSDGYWAAKRLANIPHALIERAVQAAEIGDASIERHVIDALESRRRALMNQCFVTVTPCEIASRHGSRLVLRDLALDQEIESTLSRWYDVQFLDDEGREVGKTDHVPPSADEVEIEIPPSALEAHYLVVRVTAVRGGVAAPSSFEAHYVRHANDRRLIGIRH